MSFFQLIFHRHKLAMQAACVLLGVQVKVAFKNFLQDAALFYRQLACKLQTAYGSVGFSLADAQLQTAPSIPEKDYMQQDCRPSVYRCLICLGDIFRCVSEPQNRVPRFCRADVHKTGMTRLDRGNSSNVVCRYETSVLQSQPKKDWNAAARHYRLAMTVYPSGMATKTCCQCVLAGLVQGAALVTSKFLLCDLLPAASAQQPHVTAYPV